VFAWVKELPDWGSDQIVLYLTSGQIKNQKVKWAAVSLIPALSRAGLLFPKAPKIIGVPARLDKCYGLLVLIYFILLCF